MCFLKVPHFPVCDYDIPRDEEVELCGRARFDRPQCEEVEKQRTEYPGKCFECYSADTANQSTKEAEDDMKYQQELARVLEESKDFVSPPMGAP